MAYADSDYYKNILKSNVIPDDVLESKLEAASDEVDSLTYNRIRSISFNNLTPFQQEEIKKAVCMQANFKYQYGDYLSMPLSKYVAGSTELDFNTNICGGGNTKTTEAVMNYLNQAGLTCRVL